MTQKIGEKELALRAQREARFTSAKVPQATPIAAIKEEIAQIPVKRRPKVKTKKAKQ